MFVFCSHICVYTMCMLGTHEDQKRALDHPELGLWMVVNYDVDVGN